MRVLPRGMQPYRLECLPMTLARFVLAIVAAFCLTGAPPAPAEAKAATPHQFIAGLGDNVIKVITDDASSQADKERSFRQMFNESFDSDEVMKFVLGRHWRTATEEQRREFRQAFEDLAVKTYATRFGQYSGEHFVVKDARPGASDDEYFVPSTIERDGGPPLRIDWKVRRNGDGWRIADIVVEGVSMALTYRQEYTAFIQKHGGQLQALIDTMKAKAREN
jgi:phospholipid transport system substrate-binding protein